VRVSSAGKTLGGDRACATAILRTLIAGHP
jgi:hypothetical protein